MKKVHFEKNLTRNGKKIISLSFYEACNVFESTYRNVSLYQRLNLIDKKIERIYQEN